MDTEHPQLICPHGTDLRLARWPWYVSACGRYAINAKRANVLRTFTNPDRRNRILLTPVGPSLHKMISLAWCYNPSPRNFTITDHIDGDPMNNHSSNLRHINSSLNNLNRIRLPYTQARYVKWHKGRCHVYRYFRACTRADGEDHQLHFKCRERATQATRDLLNTSFRRIYERNTPEAEKPPRLSHHIYWRDDLPPDLYCEARFRVRQPACVQPAVGQVHDILRRRGTDNQCTHSTPAQSISVNA